MAIAMKTTIDEVIAAIQTALPNTTVYRYGIPDEDDLPMVDGIPDPFVVVTPMDINSIGVGRGIIGPAYDPVRGSILVEVVTPVATDTETYADTTTGALLGFQASNTSSFQLAYTRGYEAVSSKIKPTLYVRHMLYEFITNLVK